MSTGAETGFTYRLLPGGSDWTLLLLHATGGDESQLVPLGRELAPEATLLSPRGRVLEGGRLNRFFARRGAGDLDIEDLVRRGGELAGFVAERVSEAGLRPDRVVALGYSNGANIAVELLLGHSGLLRGATLLRPMFPYRPERPPALAGADVLIAAGDRDPYSPPASTAELAELLRAGGAAVEVATARAGHELTQGDLEVARRWLAELMGAG